MAVPMLLTVLGSRGCSWSLRSSDVHWDRSLLRVIHALEISGEMWFGPTFSEWYKQHVQGMTAGTYGITTMCFPHVKFHM